MKNFQQLYQKALAIKSAIPHPRIMGIIRECGGKMHMAERQWAEAATDFFEAFKNYDEAGNQRRIQCLKYVCLFFYYFFSFILSCHVIIFSHQSFSLFWHHLLLDSKSSVIPALFILLFYVLPTNFGLLSETMDARYFTPLRCLPIGNKLWSYKLV